MTEALRTSSARTTVAEKKHFAFTGGSPVGWQKDER
jgi:hypothetical protein